MTVTDANPATSAGAAAWHARLSATAAEAHAAVAVLQAALTMFPGLDDVDAAVLALTERATA